MLLGLAAISPGCASSYMVDRGRDVADIFTVAVGVGAGVKARVGPATVGAIANVDVVGLRNGLILDPYDANVDLQSLVVPLPPCVADSPPYLSFGFEAFQLRAPCGSRESLGMIAQSGFPFITTTLVSGSNQAPLSARLKYWTQIEAAAGLGPSIRIGFNSGELLDFILGWITIDIYKDDIGRKKSNKISEDTGTSAPDHQD